MCLFGQSLPPEQILIMFYRANLECFFLKSGNIFKYKWFLIVLMLLGKRSKPEKIKNKKEIEPKKEKEKEKEKPFLICAGLPLKIEPINEIKFELNKEVLKKIRELPCITPDLLDIRKELEVLEKSDSCSNEKLYNIEEIKRKIKEIQVSISSIGLKDGFVPDLNLNVSNFLSVSAGALIEEKEAELINLFWDEKDATDKKVILNLLLDVLGLYLYNLTLHVSKLIEKSEVSELLKEEIKGLSCYFLTRIMPSLRDRLKKVSPKICQQIFIGYDTEYKNMAYGKNSLVSAQLSITGNLGIDIPIRSKFGFDTIHAVTLEKYSTNTESYLEHLQIATKKLTSYFDSSIISIRSLKYNDYDLNIEKLAEKISITKDKKRKKEKNKMLFLTSKLPVVNKMLKMKGLGLSFESLIAEAIDESGIINNLNKEINNLKKEIRIELSDDLSEYLDKPIVTEEVLESNIINRELKEYSKEKVSLEGMRFTVSNKVYLISHFNVADLSMIKDWNEVKLGNIDIMGKSYVSLRKPIILKGYNIIIRDTMLLASAAASTLKALGVMHGITKPDLDQWCYEDMGLFLEKEPEKFKEYAISDSLIALYHGIFVSNFAFDLGRIEIPSTLGSLARQCLQKYWDEKGYLGYQKDPEYLLGDSIKVSTPVGVNTLGSVGSAYSMFVGSYKGGRNEGLQYGISNKVYYDWDITSCYTTVMSMLGNPDYKRGEYILGDKNGSIEERLSKLGIKGLMNSYTVMVVDFEHKAGEKYPIIPVLGRGEKGTYVYCSDGRDIIITGLEYLKLIELGSKVKVKVCYYIPFESKKTEKGLVYVNKPYSDFIKYVQGERRKYKKKSSEERMWKDIGNMCYGSSVTGISNKEKFNARSGEMDRMVGNHMSNPIIGSWVTSYVRCLIGESLNNLNLLSGKEVMLNSYVEESEKIRKKVFVTGDIVSVTTDGFCTNLDVDLDIKRDLSGVKGIKNGFCTNLEVEKYDDSSILEVAKDDSSILEELLLSLGKEKNTFLLRAQEERLLLTDIEGKEPNPSVWELKCKVKGITQWSTRGQCSHYNESTEYGSVIATTGYTRRGKIQKELDKELRELVSSDRKEKSFVQRSLVGANLNYKTGFQCTPKLTVKSYKTIYDGRRKVIVPEDVRKEYFEKGKALPLDRMYSTSPWKESKDALLARSMMNVWKRSKYVKYCPRLLSPVSNFDDFNERSVLVDCLSGRPVDVTEKDPRSGDYNIERSVLLKDINEVIEKLGKYRSYRRNLDLIEKSLEKIDKSLRNLEMELFISSGKVVDELGLEVELVKRDVLYKREIKRLTRLVGCLKIYGLWDAMGKAGGETSIDMCRFLRCKNR